MRYVFGEVGADLGVDPDRIDAWIAPYEAGAPLRPLHHTLFHSLVAEVLANDLAAARPIAARLLDTPPLVERFSIQVTDDDPAGERPVALYSRFVDLEEENRLDLTAPTAEDIAAGRSALEEGLALIGTNDPDLDGELQGLIKEILLVGQEPGHLFTTAAVSCFQNWGGLVLNPAATRTPLAYVELLAHEATHLVLFAVAMDEPLLTNAPEERYYSPLRETMRTMDGVYHATIVAARVTRALLRQSDAEGLDPRLRALALERAAQTAQLFSDGLEIIEPNAKLTPISRQVLDDSMAYIESVRVRLSQPSTRDLVPAMTD